MLILLSVLLIGIAIGIPVAHSIAISGSLYLICKTTLQYLVIAQRMVVGVDSFTLLAIPLFLLAGELMAEGDITPRIMRFATSMVGHIRGGMAMVMVISCMIFGAISGSGVADVAAIGSILLP
jgi:TRAP-type mannitol/chloroaromatic compound transport system permease large subunit